MRVRVCRGEGGGGVGTAIVWRPLNVDESGRLLSRFVYIMLNSCRCSLFVKLVADINKFFLLGLSFCLKQWSYVMKCFVG